MHCRHWRGSEYFGDAVIREIFLQRLAIHCGTGHCRLVYITWLVVMTPELSTNYSAYLCSTEKCLTDNFTRCYYLLITEILMWQYAYCSFSYACNSKPERLLKVWICWKYSIDHKVERCFDIAAVFGNNVERVFREISSFRQSRNKLNTCFDFVEKTKFRSTLLWKTAIMSKQRSTLLLRHCCWCGRGLRPRLGLTRSTDRQMDSYRKTAGRAPRKFRPCGRSLWLFTKETEIYWYVWSIHELFTSEHEASFW